MLSEIFGFPKYPGFFYSFSNFSVTAVGGDPFLTSMIMGPRMVFPGKAPTIFGDLFWGVPNFETWFLAKVRHCNVN